MHLIRTAFVAASLALLAAAPGAQADPVDVEVTSTTVCVVDTTEDDGCDVPADVPGACATFEDPVPVESVGVLDDCTAP